MGTLTVIKADGDKIVEQRDHTTLEEVQQLVGGYIEQVPYFTTYNGTECQVWCDEEGKLKGYDGNLEAQVAWAEVAPRVAAVDQLVGDIVILTGSAMLS